MAKNKTFFEWLNEGHTLPDYVDPATEDLIKEWYSIRRIKTHFDLFLKRALDLNYPYYQQLLRIDPTKSSFDWFVQDYLERQQEISGTHEGDISTSRDKTGYPFAVKSGGYSDTDSYTNSDTFAGSETHSKTGTETDARVISGSIMRIGGYTVSKDGEDELSKSGTINREYEGKEIESEKGSEKVSDRNANSTEGSERVNAYGRTNPMSQSYTAASNTGSTEESINVTGESTPLSGVDYLSLTKPDDHFNRPNITNPTTSSDTLTENATMVSGLSEQVKSFDNRSKEKSYDHRKDVESYTNFKETQSYDNDETTTYNNMADVENKDDTMTRTHNTSDTRSFDNRVDTHQISGSKTRAYNNETVQQTLDEHVTMTVARDTTDASTNQEVKSGRHEDPAQILIRAKAYIMGSPAWNFLRSAIDPCFTQSYEDDMDDYLDEFE